jgi:hypothetical protein
MAMASVFAPVLSAGHFVGVIPSHVSSDRLVLSYKKIWESFRA